MPKWEKLCAVADIPAGSRKVFPLSALDVIVFNAGKRFYASAAECPHEGESLTGCELQGHVLICKAHGYKFDLSTGKCLTEAEIGIPIFPVEVRDDSLWVKF